VPGDMTVWHAHEICDRVEAAIGLAVPEARVTIHVEPEHKSKNSGILLSD
jgi:divalent metal cation (Fe/Co/Zn/Cd) transporter